MRFAKGRLQDAIDSYHRALSWRPEDAFAAEMLTAAMKEAVDADFSLLV